MRLWLGVVLIALVMGACNGGEPEEAEAPPEPSPTGTTTETGCFDPSRDSLGVLAGGITLEGTTLAVNAIAAEDSEGLWYVAGELQGEDLDGSGKIALWATDEDPADHALDFTAVNALAIEHSDWEPDGDIPEDDPAIDEVSDCVEETRRG